MFANAFQLDARILSGINACGYTNPTPIQKETIPCGLKGRDIMGLAQTGTGKTAAFALPILHKLLQSSGQSPRALVMAPTRELAEQICLAFTTLGQNTKLRFATIYGGVNINPQVQTLRRGADVVVACPGRLLDHISRKTIDLRNIDILVLDEADMMLDMGFLPDIRRILKHLPVKRQNMMFSATMPDPIRELSKDILVEPVVARVQHTKPLETVAHALYPVAQERKSALLVELLSKMDAHSVLIFTRTKHRAKKIGAMLEGEGHSATSLQGNLAQNARRAALDGFRNGKFNVLVATDIAARGIDVQQVSHVINFDLPDTTDAYTHRIGRTGRALRTGDAFSFISEEDEPQVRAIEKILGAPVERRYLPDFDYTARSKKETPERKGRGRQGERNRTVQPRRQPKAAQVSKPRERQVSKPREQQVSKPREQQVSKPRNGGEQRPRTDENRRRGASARGLRNPRKSSSSNPGFARPATGSEKRNSSLSHGISPAQQPAWSAAYHTEESEPRKSNRRSRKES